MTSSEPRIVALDNVTVDDFAPLVGQHFAVSATQGGAVVAHFSLKEARPGRAPGSNRAPFSLLFQGPAQPPYEQQVFWLHNEELGWADIFLVPVGANAEKRTYQAVFG
jgi:hypothetical protein